MAKIELYASKTIKAANPPSMYEEKKSEKYYWSVKYIYSSISELFIFNSFGHIRVEGPTVHICMSVCVIKGFG